MNGVKQCVHEQTEYRMDVIERLDKLSCKSVGMDGQLRWNLEDRPVQRTQRASKNNRT